MQSYNTYTRTYDDALPCTSLGELLYDSIIIIYLARLEPESGGPVKIEVAPPVLVTLLGLGAVSDDT